MTIPPCAVTSHQSPWVQTPGNRSKYAARYFSSPGSFQKPRGSDGNGLVQTSSPFCCSTERPFSSKTSTLRPRARHWISPRHTGRIGLPSTKHPQISVPPDIEERHTSLLIALYTKSKASGAYGGPVHTTVPKCPGRDVVAGAA